MLAKTLVLHPGETITSPTPQTDLQTEHANLQELSLPTTNLSNRTAPVAADGNQPSVENGIGTEATREQLFDLIQRRMRSIGFAEYHSPAGTEPSGGIGWTSESGFDPDEVKYFVASNIADSQGRPALIAFAVSSPGATVYWRQNGESRWHAVSDDMRYVVDNREKGGGWQGRLNSLANQLEERQTPVPDEFLSPNAELFLADPLTSAAMLNDSIESFLTYCEKGKHQNGTVSVLKWDLLRKEYANWPGPKVDRNSPALWRVHDGIITSFGFRRTESGGLQAYPGNEKSLKNIENAYHSKPNNNGEKSPSQDSGK